MKKFFLLALIVMLMISVTSCEVIHNPASEISSPVESGMSILESSSETENSSSETENSSSEEIQAPTEPKNYTILQVGGYDYLSWANHVAEVELYIEEYQDETAEKLSSIRYYNGSKYDSYWMRYQSSQRGYLYHSDVDYYTREMVKVAVNKTTGTIDRYIYMPPGPAGLMDGFPSSQEKCLAEAIAYLNYYTDASAYTLTETRYLEIPEYHAIYSYKFVRMMNGIATSDCAYIGVTVYGTVISHNFTCLGQMDDAPIMSEDDMEQIKSQLFSELKEIYSKKLLDSKGLGLTYNINDITLIRLRDGRYALDIYVQAHLFPLSPKDGDAGLTETTRFLICWDNG